MDKARERRERITQRVAAGEPITKVAADEGISRQRVSQIIHKQGLVLGLHANAKAWQADMSTAELLHGEGFTPDEIATRVGRSGQAVRAGLRKFGVLVPRKRKYETVPHGTAYGYGEFKCRCDLCRAAHNQSHKEWGSRPESKDSLLQARRRYDSRYPQRRAAYGLLNAAVRAGKITKPDRCGCGRQARVQGHHDDYSKPLDVVWLCGACHKARHQMKRLSKAA
jgi:hypothetical protein